MSRSRSRPTRTRCPRSPQRSSSLRRVRTSACRWVRRRPSSRVASTTSREWPTCTSPRSKERRAAQLSTTRFCGRSARLRRTSGSRRTRPRRQRSPGASPRSSLGRALRRIPVWVWLTAIVVGSAAIRASLARDIVAPFIMVDEVIWSELARGIAASAEPLVRGEPDTGYSVVYPVLISPAYLLFESLPQAYAAVKSENAVLMSLAAVPAFFLARRVVGDGLALLAAVLAVALPSLAYTGTVMTENAFYPLFLVVALVLVLVLERPTPGRVVLLLVLLTLAFATRVQAVALLPAVLLAPLLLSVFERRGIASTV